MPVPADRVGDPAQVGTARPDELENAASLSADLIGVRSARARRSRRGCRRVPPGPRRTGEPRRRGGGPGQDVVTLALEPYLCGRAAVVRRRPGVGEVGWARCCSTVPRRAASVAPVVPSNRTSWSSVAPGSRRSGPAGRRRRARRTLGRSSAPRPRRGTRMSPALAAGTLADWLPKRASSKPTHQVRVPSGSS